MVGLFITMVAVRYQKTLDRINPVRYEFSVKACTKHGIRP
jgi:hypothetical protein